MLRIVTVAVLLTLAFAGQVSAQIVALGASSTAGKGVGASESFPAQLEAMLHAKGRAVSIANAGISGDTTAGMLSRLDSATPAGTRIVILQIAGNDGLRGMSASAAAANRAEIRRKLHARGIRTVEADGLVMAALRRGWRQPDGIHMTAEGHHWVAEQLARSIR